MSTLEFQEFRTATGMVIRYVEMSPVKNGECRMEGMDETGQTWSAIGIVKGGKVERVRSQRLIPEKAD
ncbi:MAG: hypothetical protein HGA87_02480 [Desulfobulbaceae bacterium]|nr:hypothetical protein [Desulfobulbaceae bacterium]